MADFNLDGNIDEYRSPHESSGEWALKKKFILAHQDKFEKDRLICLASCYVNVEFYGNRYPAGVMRLLKELVQDLPEDDYCVPANIMKRNQVKFVKSSDPTGFETPDEPTSTIFDTPSSPAVQKNKKHKSLDMMFVKSGENLSMNMNMSTGKSDYSSLQEHSEEVKKFRILASHLKHIQKKGSHPVEIVQMAIDKSRMTSNPVFDKIPGDLFTCEVFIDFVFVGKAQATNKKQAKFLAYEEVIRVLMMPHLSIENVEPDKKFLRGSLEEHNTATHTHAEDLEISMQNQQKGAQKYQTPPKSCNISQLEKLFSQFLILVHVKSDNAISELHSSAQFNKCPFDMDYVSMDAHVTCNIQLDGEFVGDGVGDSTAEAKKAACENVLRTLKKICWTIQLKQGHDTDETGINRDVLLGEIQSDVQISESNVGSKMLKKMGWTGGGLGKVGNEGIVEPIKAGAEVINRSGLGLLAEKGIPVDFRRKVEQMLSEYVRSDKQTDLALSSEFTREERALVHEIARKLHLKTRSFGSGEERYLVISRKRNAGQLFNHIMKSGGETSKYTLIPPGQEN